MKSGLLIPFSEESVASGLVASALTFLGTFWVKPKSAILEKARRQRKRWLIACINSHQPLRYVRPFLCEAMGVFASKVWRRESLNT
jgi:hypothetical protein